MFSFKTVWPTLLTIAIGVAIAYGVDLYKENKSLNEKIITLNKQLDVKDKLSEKKTEAYTELSKTNKSIEIVYERIKESNSKQIKEAKEAGLTDEEVSKLLYASVIDAYCVGKETEDECKKNQ